MGVPCVFGLGFDKNTCMGQGHGVMECSPRLERMVWASEGKGEGWERGEGVCFPSLEPMVKASEREE